MRIGIVDDDKLVCASLKTILQADPMVEVVGIGNSGEQAVALYCAHQPDVLLMDIRMEPMTGLVAGEEILRDFPQARILFLTTFSDDAYIVKALQIGAKGYILKQNFESIAPALRAVMNGQSVFGDEIVGKLPDLLHNRMRTAAGPALSERVNALLERLAQGMSNREIAKALCLSEGTVRNYLSALLEKLGLRDRTQLVIYYYNHRK